MRKCCDEVKVVKEDECVTEAKNAFLSVALIVGILTIIVGICVAVYKYLTPDYLDDFDDYDDDFDDSFFDDDDAEASTSEDGYKNLPHQNWCGRFFCGGAPCGAQF